MGYSDVHIVFEKVAHRAVKTVACPGCGRRLMRQKTFEMTLNPWNRNADGTPRSRDQIREALRLEARAWREEPAWHVACLP